MGFFTLKGCDTGPMVYCPCWRRLESLTIRRCHYLVSTFKTQSALMPALPDYSDVSRIRNESPGLSNGSSNLLDKNDFEPSIEMAFPS